MHLIPSNLSEDVAQRFKVLSEPARLRLLNELHEHGELSVQELVEASGLRQANVSKHLNLMARGGILKRRKEGLFVFYSVADQALISLLTATRDWVANDMRQRLEAISAPVAPKPSPFAPLKSGFSGLAFNGGK